MATMLTIAEAVAKYKTSKYELKRRRADNVAPLYVHHENEYLYADADLSALFAKR